MREPLVQCEHLVGRHPAGKPEELGQVAERLPRRERARGGTRDLGAPARRADEPARDLDERRLAGAVRAEQPHELPRLDRQIDACERLDPPVALLEARNAEDGSHEPSLPGGSSLFDVSVVLM